MRTTFHHYFRPTEAELDALLADALICYDANVLLNVYRYSEETRKGLIEVFNIFASRTYIPHQAALEYARSRAKTIIDQTNLCQDTENALKKVIKDYIEPKDKQPFLSEKSSSALIGVMEELAEKREALESMISEDQYADMLLNLFDQSVGEAPDEATLKMLHDRAADRYAKKIPPGYSDEKDKDAPRSYGDFIVWHQLMDVAKGKKRDIILVTDDRKADWRLRISGRTIGPRPELLEEFRRETAQRIWLFTSEGFLIATKEAGSADVPDSVISEIGAHLAQASTDGPDVKLSGPSGFEETNRGSSGLKLSDSRTKRVGPDTYATDASAEDQKVTRPGEEDLVDAGKRTMVTKEDEGREI